MTSSDNVKDVETVAPPSTPAELSPVDVPSSDNVVVFCYYIRKRNGTCTNEKCAFNHDVEAFKTANDLKECPSENCSNYCKVTSAKCATCRSLLDPKFCFKYFKDFSCTDEKCKYLHDVDRYKAKHGLKDCPYEGCTNYCKITSSKCSKCFQEDKAARGVNIKFCFGRFGRDGECKNGDDCKFSHDVDLFMTKNGLKNCPNCSNFCKADSVQCKHCSAADRTSAELPQKKCQGFNCREYTPSKFCQECYKINKRYVL